MNTRLQLFTSEAGAGKKEIFSQGMGPIYSCEFASLAKHSMFDSYCGYLLKFFK